MYWTQALNAVPGAIVNNVQRMLFRNRDLANNVPGTQISAVDANMVWNELLGVLDGAGVAPDPADQAQVLAAILALIRRQPGYMRSAAFKASGNWVAPAGVTVCRVRAWGEGGPGASSASAINPGGGGGGGGYAEGVYAVVPGQIYAVTVFGGQAAGQPGRDTSVAGMLSAGGGGPGQLGSADRVGAGGAGGSGQGGTSANFTGSPGTTGINYTGDQGGVEGGMGGSAPLGPGPSRATGGTASGFAGNNGAFPGGGGSGCIGATGLSGGGHVIIDY